MHCSKGTNIKNACPNFKDRMLDIGGNRHSLLLDEWNDISLVEMHGISVISYGNNCLESCTSIFCSYTDRKV